MTGVAYFTPELCAKRLELLKETMPRLTDVGVLLNPINPANAQILPAMRRTAEPLKLKLHQFGVREPAEFERGLERRRAAGQQQFEREAESGREGLHA